MWSQLRLYTKAFYISARDALEDDLLIYGGYAAYTSILAVFPFIIFLMALSSVLGDAALAEQLIQEGFEVMPAQVVEAVAPVIREIMSNQDNAVMGLAAIGTLWVASSGIEGLRFGLNAVYRVKEPRAFWRRRLQGIFFVLAYAFAFLVLAILLIAWPIIENFLSEYVYLRHQDVLAFIRYALAFLILATGLSQMYYFLPNVKQKWRQTYPGAFVATILWIALASLFSVYVSNFGNYATSYGSIAGVIITLIFLHFSSAAVLFGGQYNAALKRLRGIPIKPAETETGSPA